jgi:hypothetical protein
MWGKLSRDLKARWNPAIAIAAITLVGIGGVWWLGGRSWLSFSNQPSSLEPLSDLDSTLSATEPESTEPKSPPLPALQPPASLPKPDPAAIAVRLGALRISNPTEHPVRVALLAKQAAPHRPATQSPGPYELPAHWDFAPQEGSETGMIVGLAGRSLRIQPGDILVAFAQDGSRRYWGPFVVGQTELPIWDVKLGEWQLILQP